MTQSYFCEVLRRTHKTVHTSIYWHTITLAYSRETGANLWGTGIPTYWNTSYYWQKVGVYIYWQGTGIYSGSGIYTGEELAYTGEMLGEPAVYLYCCDDQRTRLNHFQRKLQIGDKLPYNIIYNPSVLQKVIPTSHSYGETIKRVLVCTNWKDYNYSQVKRVLATTRAINLRTLLTCCSTCRRMSWSSWRL